MLASALIVASFCGGAPYTPGNYDRPIASRPDYPAGMADDVRRPGFNGRLHVTRPIMGALQGPWAEAQPAPGPDHYGAYLNPCDAVPARVGLLVISISPWAEWTEQGHKGLEEARQFWLSENGYTGGVRTFVNDYYLFSELRNPAPAPQADSGKGQPEPAAIIELAPDAPRHKSRLRVEARPTPDMTAAASVLREQRARISWPHNTPSAFVARTAAAGDMVQRSGSARAVITAAK